MLLHVLNSAGGLTPLQQDSSGNIKVGDSEIAVPSTNGTTNLKVTSLATTNSLLVKATAGRIVNLSIVNTSAAVKFVKLYNKATAPTVGTDASVKLYLIPAGATLDVSINDYGIYFSAGIGLGITGLYADTDVTAVAVGDVVVNISYV